MDDTPNIVRLNGHTKPAAWVSPPPGPVSAAPALVCFDRREMSLILNVYGRMVAAGEWRDYAVTWLKDVAIFSIYRRTSEMPLFRVEKRPRLRMKQGAYAILGQTGQVLRRGHDLAQVLRVLEKQLIRAVDR